MHWVITAGDPAGVGPSVAARAALRLVSSPKHVGAKVTLVGCAAQLGALCKAHGREFSAERFIPMIDMVDVGRISQKAISTHAPTIEGGQAQWQALARGVELVKSELVSQDSRPVALVTAPMSKTAVALAGHSFSGHTEFLAQSVGLARQAVTMCFVGPRLVVALATTHIPLAKVSQGLTQDVFLRSLNHLADLLLRLYPGAAWRREIVVAGLNPHAGENGLLGREELDLMTPWLESHRGTLHARGIADVCLQGAETAFRQSVVDPSSNRRAGVLAMYHDQATIASKLLDWEQAVNVTCGLPFVRTSVDHGVAYDAAAQGTASAAGMHAACDMALRLSRSGLGK